MTVLSHVTATATAATADVSAFTASAAFFSRYYDPQIPTDEYGVKETEPIGWLAAAMQQQNSEMPAAMEEEVKRKSINERKGHGRTICTVDLSLPQSSWTALVFWVSLIRVKRRFATGHEVPPAIEVATPENLRLARHLTTRSWCTLCPLCRLNL